MRTCTKCGLQKDEGEFYRRGGRTRHGKAVTGPHSICKACAKNRIGKRRSATVGKDYESWADYAKRIADRKRARLEREREVIEKARKDRPWRTACRRAMRKLNRKDDPWTRRIDGARVSLRLRAPAAKRKSATKAKGLTWRTRFSKEVRNLNIAPKDAWTRRIENAVSSLRKRRRRRAHAH